LAEAEHAWVKFEGQMGDRAALEEILQVVTTGVSCILDHGLVERVELVAQYAVVTTHSVTLELLSAGKAYVKLTATVQHEGDEVARYTFDSGDLSVDYSHAVHVLCNAYGDFDITGKLIEFVDNSDEYAWKGGVDGKYIERRR
jgi:hypothetical protein